MKQEEYIISGMSCAACSASVQRVVSRLEGVESCDVNLITGKMTVSYDEQKTGQADFTRVVEKAGFGIRPDTPEETKLTVKMAKTLDISRVFVLCAFSGDNSVKTLHNRYKPFSKNLTRTNHNLLV